ncbi:MAG: hypothetical protein AB7E72_04845 [Lysobacterales bacterium]
MGVIAAGASEDKPQSGQKHRSGPNFQLLSNDGNQITLSGPPGVVFDVKQDKSAATDPTPISSATNGTVVPGGTLKTGTNYYIANPQHATSGFAVTFSQD